MIRLLTKPRPFQRAGSLKLQEFGLRGLLADEMGLGKSFQALLCLFWNQDEIKTTVIVCPASLKQNWYNECLKHIGVRPWIISSTKAKKLPSNRIYIINYDILGSWLKFLMRRQPDLLIMDECHYCGSPRTKRTKASKTLAKGVSRVLALSGTPITSQPAQLFPVLNMLRPDLFPTFYPFAQRYTEPELTPWGWKFSGARNLKELNKILRKSMMVRRLKKDVLSDLPKEQRIVVPLPIHDRKQYEYAMNNFLSWLSKISLEKARKAAKFVQAAKLVYVLQLIARLKMKAVFEWLDNYLHESSGKLIIFCVHRKIIQEIHDRYKKTSVVIHGGVTGSKRHKVFEAFLTNKKIDFCVCQLDVGGVGLSARGVSNKAFIELSWKPAPHLQAEARTHGIGRGKEGVQSTSFYLIAQDTLEEKLVKMIHQKQEYSDVLFDGSKDASEFDLLDLFLKEMKTGGMQQ